MASNGLLKRATTGTCRICQRRRNTTDQVKAVGELRKGFATGHIWECIDIADCDKAAENRMSKYTPGSLIYEKIKDAIASGRFVYYKIFTK